MHRKSSLARALSLGAVSLASVAGCLVVSPLEDHPDPSGEGGTMSEAGSPSLVAGEAGEPSGGQGSSTGGCTTNEDCVRPGANEPYRCHSDHTCVRLSSSECPVVLGATSDPNAIYIGAFATVDQLVPERSTIFWSHELARDQLSGDEIGGLRAKPGGARRPLVIVGCDNTEARVELALEHLVNTVEVPAMLATLKPGDLRRAFEKYRSRELFYLSPVAVTETLLEEEDDGLIWNLLGQPSDLAPAYAELLRLSETYVRSTQNVAAPAPIKVAFVTSLAAFDSDLADAVRPLLELNGKSAEENGMASFREFTIGNDPDLAALGDSIAEFGPNIVVSAASEAFSQPAGVLNHIEDEWNDHNDIDIPRPFYILSPYNAGDLAWVQGYIDYQLKNVEDSDVHTRFVGLSIANAEDITLQNAYESKLGSLFPDAYKDSANYYDAVYFLAYAMYGSTDTGPLTGPGIAAGMQRLLSGESIDIGSTTINDVFDALDVEEGTLQLESTLGPPSFDPETGVRPVDAGVFCFFSQNGTPSERRLDVQRYDRALGEFRDGRVAPCFSGLFP